MTFPDQPLDPEDLPDEIIVNGETFEKCSCEECDCDLCRMGIEVEEVEPNFFMATCDDAFGLYGFGEFPEEAVAGLMEWLVGIPNN